MAHELGIAGRDRGMLAASAVLSRLWTRALVRPINEIDLEDPLKTPFTTS